MVPKGSEINAKKPEDLCGLKLGLEQGTTWVKEFKKLSDEYCVPNNKGAITVSEYPSAPEVTQALLSKNIQAQVEIAGAAKMIAEKTNGRVVITTEHPIYQQTLGIFVKKGNDETFKEVQKAFEESKKSGYAAILQKYGLESRPPTKNLSLSLVSAAPARGRRSSAINSIGRISYPCSPCRTSGRPASR
jgi:polar amino acid transport system substrate-binding protein